MHHTYQMQRLVQLATQNWLAAKGDVKLIVKGVIMRLNDVFPFPDHENKELWMRYLPHALKILELRDDHTVEETRTMLLFEASQSDDKVRA